MSVARRGNAARFRVSLPVAAVVLAVVGLCVATLRLWRPAASGPGDGRGPGGAGVREPRRPAPGPPGDTVAVPVPDGS